MSAIDWENEVTDMLNRCDWICPANEKHPGICDHVRTLLGVIESQRYMMWPRERKALLYCADELIGMMERALEDDAVAEAESIAREAAS